MITRKEQLEYCTTCTKRLFDRNKGLVCSLTGEHADFNNSCNDYNEDAVEFNKVDEKRRREALEKLDKETWGLSSIGITNLVTVGIIFMILAVVAEILIVYFFNRISFYPVIVFVLSIISIVKGVKRNKKVKNQLT